jgi:hemerythrin-like domain-containing protein
MNTATENLKNDHVHILRLIDVMEKMVLTSDTSISNIESVISLIKNYADGFHHAKEENLFFPIMVKKGFSREQGPISVMLHEHVLGRNYVKGMTEGIEAMKGGNKASIGIIYENMQGYIVLLRNHIAKENNVLFKMADNVLSENDHKELLTEFEKLEKSNYSGSVLAESIRAIEKLESAYKA